MNPNTIIYTCPIMGELTVQDFLYYLEHLIKETEEDLNLLRNLLDNAGLKKEDLASFFPKFNLAKELKFIRDVFSNTL